MIMIRMGRAIPVPRPARAVSRKRGRHDPNRANSPAALVLRDADVVAAEHGLEGVPKRAELAVKSGADGVAVVELERPGLADEVVELLRALEAVLRLVGAARAREIRRDEGRRAT